MPSPARRMIEPTSPMAEAPKVPAFSADPASAKSTPARTNQPTARGAVATVAVVRAGPGRRTAPRKQPAPSTASRSRTAVWGGRLILALLGSDTHVFGAQPDWRPVWLGSPPAPSRRFRHGANRTARGPYRPRQDRPRVSLSARTLAVEDLVEGANLALRCSRRRSASGWLTGSRWNGRRPGAAGAPGRL
jgi:hypothetical protein